MQKSDKRSAQTNILNVISALYVVLLLTIFLFGFSPNGYSNIADSKYFLFLVICGGYVGLTVLIRLELALVGQSPLKKPKKIIKDAPLIIWFLIIYICLTLVSSLLSQYDGSFKGAYRNEGALTITFYGVSCILLSKYLRPKRWMIFLLAAAVSLICVLALIQLTGANPFYLYPKPYNYYDAGVYYPGEYLGTIGNASFFAAFLCIAIGVVAIALISLDFKKKWLLAIPLTLSVFTLLEINVDAGLVGVFAGLLLMIPVAVINRKRLSGTMFVLCSILVGVSLSLAFVFGDGFVSFGITRLFLAGLIVAALLFGAGMALCRSSVLANVSDKHIRRCAVLIVLLIIVAAFLYLWFYKGSDSGLIYEASEVLHGRRDDSFGTRRFYIWRNILERLDGHLLFGTGPDTLGAWDIPPFTRYSDILEKTVTTHIDAAHNEYLNIIACQGLLAFLAYVAMLACAAIKWYRTPQEPLYAVAGAGALFYCIQAFFGISSCIAAPFFWTILAVLISNNKKI